MNEGQEFNVTVVDQSHLEFSRSNNRLNSIPFWLTCKYQVYKVMCHLSDIHIYCNTSAKFKE